MGRQLHIARIYKIELEYGGLCGDETVAFRRLIDLLDIETQRQSDADDYYEIERDELEYLRDILDCKHRLYEENAEAIGEILSEAGTTRERMVAALDVMITESDQSDSLVHIFCD